MKNKYQKALSDMVDNGVTNDYFNEKAKLPQSENPLFTIQELVDRATPIKVLHLYENKYSCGNCHIAFKLKTTKENRFVNNSYCDVCGQALEWGEEDE